MRLFIEQSQYDHLFVQMTACYILYDTTSTDEECFLERDHKLSQEETIELLKKNFKKNLVIWFKCYYLCTVN